MENRNKFLRKGGLVVLFILIAGITYLPNLPNFGYFNDDWYLMYAANAHGPGAFEGIYSIDRPARSIVMATAFSLFGMDPLYYNLSAFLFRVLGALVFLWTLRIIWPRQTTATVAMALLFLIYPGFLSAPNAIDYQAQQISLFLALVSIAASVRAVVESRLFIKVLLWFLATLTAIEYLGLVEYFLGLEEFQRDRCSGRRRLGEGFLGRCGFKAACLSSPYIAGNIFCRTMDRNCRCRDTRAGASGVGPDQG